MVPCKAKIGNIITKLYSMGSVLDKNKFQKKPRLTEEKLDNSAPLEASPKKSLCH
jgi:hypothetical protein